MKKFNFKKLIIILVIFASTSNFCKTFLVFGGKTGWIGQKIVQSIISMGHEAICARSRLENREEIEKEIAITKPDYIINAAGLTGRPNVDWCEDHKQETIRVNVTGTLNLADIAFLHNIQMTNFSTGCIYEYDEKHPQNTGKGFKEEDEPNLINGSFYSKTKILLEKLLLEYPNVLNLRVKMPVSSDMNPRSFIGKIIKYKKVINIPNSLTILDDLIPISIEMTLKNFRGNYNFANPGSMSHNEVLELYKKYIDHTLTYENFSVEEQNKILKGKRSNCELDVTKLMSHFPDIPNVKISLENLLIKVASKKIESYV